MPIKRNSSANSQAMHSRREIRESAVQFLYCLDLEGGASAENLCDTFWDLVLESDTHKLHKATIKALLHLNQGRAGRYVKLSDRAPEAISLMKADPNAEKLRITLDKILAGEAKWQPLIDRISLLHQPSESRVPSELRTALKDLFTLNRSLTALRNDYFNLLQDYPLLNKQTEGLTSVIRALQRVSDRASMVENPASSPDSPEIKHLRDSNARIETFRQNVDDLATAVLSSKPELDAAIDATVENFRPERVDPVDRAILRLAIYEILYRESVPSNVAINEALEIAKKFASADSHKFINGILDKVAKGNSQTTEPTSAES